MLWIASHAGPRFIALLMMASVSSAAVAQAPSIQTFVLNEGNTQYERGLFDVGRNYVQVRLDMPPPQGGAAGRLICESSRLERAGDEFRVVVTYDDQSPDEVICQRVQNVTLGELQPGAYSLLMTLVRADGTGVVETRSTFDVQARGAVCGLTPTHTLLELGYPTDNPTAFIERYNLDPELRHSLGDVTLRSWQPRGAFSVISADYPALADTQRVLAALRGSGLFRYVGNLWLSGGCMGICTPDLTRVAVEYHHAANDRYFFTDEPAEIAKLDASGTAGGWVRTGESWQVIRSPSFPEPVLGETQMVYRFWSADVSGVPSHFFTVDRQECAQLRDGEKVGWTFEGAPFWARFPKGDACVNGIPLYRLYNNSKGGAPSHRFATRLPVVEAMQAQGWTNEGVAMCVANPT